MKPEELKSKLYLTGYIKDEWGYQDWYVDGLHHRDGGPAIIDPDGTETWIQHGQMHREDGPAFIQNGYVEFYLKDKQMPLDKWLEVLDISKAEKVLLKMQWG